MNPAQPPLLLGQPHIERRRSESRPVPLPAERIRVRAETARMLSGMVETINAELDRLDTTGRSQVLIKVEHERPVDLAGTNLKPITAPSEHVTLTVLKDPQENLSQLHRKITEFGTAPLVRGQPKHKQLDVVQSVRKGEATDRLSDRLYEQYAALTAGEGFQILEIEVASFQTGPRQQRAEIASILQELNALFQMGIRGNLFEHEELGNTCRAVIRCKGTLFKQLVEDPAWLRKIVWFEERPRFRTFREIRDSFQFSNLGPITPPPLEAQAVCVVDSGVTPQNPFLQPVTRPELLKSFLRSDPDNPYDGYGHGSAVASLVAYNGLNLAVGAVNEGKVWVASARIVTDDDELEDNRLFSALLREVVEHFKPLGVRIFNLSIGNINLKWNLESQRTVERKSWVARAIDRLSKEHDVIFVTCTGNILCPDLNAYATAGLRYPAYFADRGAAVLDPGQAALALTVGSIAPGTLVATAGPDTAVAVLNQPSPFTRSGPGIKRECKPELVDHGGNFAADATGRIRAVAGLMIPVATHQITPAVTYEAGTSFAAPRVAHKLALVLQDLEDGGIDQPSSALLKAFLVNSATYRADPEHHAAFVEALDALQRWHWLNVLGYGQADAGRATDCDDYSSLMYFEGFLEQDRVAFFDVPVPASLASAGRGRKRLTVTLVSTPEVQKNGLQSYLGTTTKWRMFRGDVSREQIVAAMSREDEEEGTAAAEPESESADEGEGGGPKELKFELGLTRRSRGTVQHDWYEWSQHREAYSAGHYTLAVAAYERWDRKEGRAPPLPFAVVVRLEDLARSVPIYAEVRQVLQVPRVQT